jgi:hypothetical protein
VWARCAAWSQFYHAPTPTGAGGGGGGPNATGATDGRDPCCEISEMETR